MNNSRFRVNATLLLAMIYVICWAARVLAQEPPPRPPNPTVQKTSTKRSATTRKTPRSNPSTPARTTTHIPYDLVFYPPAGYATISGEITWVGPLPRKMKIDTAADPVCSEKNPNLEVEQDVVSRGKLANVFVYLKDGTTDDGRKLSELSFDAPTNQVVLDQSGCRFVPHVLGVMVNQPITITNSDPTTHNVHFTPKKNPDWNQSQPNGAAPLTHRLARAEVMVPVKDNQHPWKRAYFGVLTHPFFAVTKEDGRFEIRGVPSGTYTVAAWHEGGSIGFEKTIELRVH